MNVNQRGMIALMKSAVTQIPQPLPQDFSVEAVYSQIKSHHMITMAYDGAVRCGVSADDPAMRNLFQDYCKCLLISKRQMTLVERICSAFDENNIDYMLLKGCKMKDRYPLPELRAMGDADILIRVEQYDRIRPLMERLGFIEKYDTDHELVWECSGLAFELHKRLIPSYNVDLYKYFGDGWELATVNNGNRYEMTPEDEWIYLFTHFAKHYRDGGIGCRYVLDLWIYLRTNPNLNEAYVSAELKKLKLLEFYRNVRRLIEVWFEDAPMDDMSEYLTEFIFASGSWGQMDSRLVSRTVRDAKRSILGFNGRMVYIWQTLFPSVDVLKGKYKVLKKAPWLLPVVWIIRPFYKLLFERDTLKRQEDNLNALDQDNLAHRQQMLQYVGLDYHS